MAIRVTDRWRHPPRGTAEQAKAVFRTWGSFPIGDVDDAVDTAYDVCERITLDAALLIAHAALETGDRIIGKGFLDKAWATIDSYQDPRNRYNISGMGITDWEDLGYRWANGTEAMLAHIVHHARYEISPDDPAWEVLRPYIHLDKRFDAVPAGNRGTVRTVADMTGKWWTNRDGHTNLARRGNQIFPDLPDQQGEPPASDGTGGTGTEHSMEYIAYRFPAAPRDAYLPAWITVSIRPVDHPRVRSYQKASDKRYTTVHDTGNPRTNAEGEYAWLAGGRQGGEVGGYQWINDDRILIITGYFDEVTWAQGTPDGNRLSDAGELAYGGAVVWNDALEIACAMHGAVLEMRGLDANDAAVLHQWWYGKWCAAQVLNRGLWPTVVRKIDGYAKAAAQARAGGVTIPAPSVYATPVPVIDPATNLPWDGTADITLNGNVYEAQRITAPVVNGPLNRRQWAGTESQLTGAAYAMGDAIDLLGWVKGQLVDGISEWWVDTQGNRLWAGGFDLEPKQDPDWSELPSELPPGMTGINGHPYYPLYPDDLTEEEETALDGAAPPLGRKITVKQDGKLYKWANPASGAVGEVKAGEEVVFKYWTRGEPQTATAPDGTTFEEVIWYAQDLHTGGRMWAGLSDEKPD